MATTPDVSALAAYAGKYEKKLFSTLRNSLDIANDVTVIPGVKNSLLMTKLKVKAGVRPYRETFDAAADDLQYSGRTLVTHLAKRDISINPLKYRDTWMSEVMADGINEKEIPFAAFVWDQVMKDFADEINGAAYLGTYNASGSTAAAIITGIGTTLAAEITATTVTPVTTGAIVKATAYDQFKAIWRSLPVAYRNAGAIIYCSYASAEALADGFETNVGKYTESDLATGAVYLSTTNRKCLIKPVTWMGTSGRLICTPKENIVMGVDMLSDANKVITTPYLERLDSRILFQLGLNFRDLDAIVCNEQS